MKPVDAESFEDGHTNGIDIKNSSCLLTFDEAFGSYQQFGFLGLGFVFTQEDPFICWHINNCYDLKTKRIKKFAKRIINQLNSYAEISGNETGINIFVEAQIPLHNLGIRDIEIYSFNQFVEITGFHLAETPTKILKRQKVLNRLLPQALNSMGYFDIESDS